MAIAARVVDGSTGPTAITTLPVTPESRGATRFDGSQCTKLDRGQRPCPTQFVAVKSNDVRQLRSCSMLRRRPVRYGTGHRSVLRRLRKIKQIQWRTTFRYVSACEVEVAHRGTDVTVPEKSLDRMKVRPGLEQMRCKRMSQ